jgi:hypothetical protein
VWSSVRGNAFPIAISRFELPWKKTLRIEGEANFDNKLVSSLLGELILAAVGS